jgi:spore coat polysaccharide biosynthesis predicted glycosyltransferase SpsG
MLDDDARLSEYPCDLILNQNLSAAPELYGRQGVYPRLLLGTSFTLLRPEFLQMRIARKSSTVARRLLVSMGAGDRENVTQIVVNALPALRNKMNVVVVIGPGNPHKKAIRAATAHLQNVQIVHDPPDMALLMRNSDIAISGAGSTCWELAYMGVPMVLAVLASNQRPIAQALERSGAAINLGDSARLSTARIADCVDRLAEDGDRRRKMSQAGRKCVDGRGAQRIVEILRSHS